jgi:hypothetical protein
MDSALSWQVDICEVMTERLLACDNFSGMLREIKG